MNSGIDLGTPETRVVMTRERRFRRNMGKYRKEFRVQNLGNGVQGISGARAHLRQDSIEEAAMNHLNPLF